MATLVQSKSGTRSGGSATSQTLTIVLTAPATSGNSLAIAWATGGGSQVQTLTSITDDKGNTYTVNQNNTTGIFTSQSGCATLLNQTNAPQTISISVGASVADNIGIAATVYEVSGVNAVDVSTHGSPGSSTALSATFSTAFANEFAFASVVNNNSAATYTQNNGWTQDNADGFTGGYTFHNVLALAGANSLDATASAAVFNLWSIVTLNGASSPGAAALTIAGNTPARVMGTILIPRTA
jgi:hypothetical protein